MECFLNNTFHHVPLLTQLYIRAIYCHPTHCSKKPPSQQQFIITRLCHKPKHNENNSKYIISIHLSVMHTTQKNLFFSSSSQALSFVIRFYCQDKNPISTEPHDVDTVKFTWERAVSQYAVSQYTMFVLFNHVCRMSPALVNPNKTRGLSARI